MSLLTDYAVARETLRVLTWPGYADSDLVKTFEDRTGSHVEVSIIDSDESLWLRLHDTGHEQFDVFAVNSAELQRYIKADLVQPINVQAITNRSHQLPRFRELERIPGLVHDGKTFAIPYTYSEMGLIYDRTQMSEPPATIAALWDPRYRGKVIAYNGGAHNFTLAAQSLSHITPFYLDQSDWPAVVDRLIELRRNVLGFYTQPQESIELFVSHRAALLFANFGSQQFQMLKAKGIDIGYAIPREGALAWLDCWTVVRGTPNAALAEAWINYMLEKAPSEALHTRQGLANTTQAADGNNNADKLVWLEPVEDPERRNLLWRRIMSGSGAGKVMSP